MSPMAAAWAESSFDRVGRCGELRLEFAARGGETELITARSSSPWHFLPPTPIDEGHTTHTFLVNPSGGLVGGDRLSCSASLGEGAHVLMSTPSANRVYRTNGPPAVQDVQLHLGPGARLEWMPDVTIPFAGSRFHQCIHAILEAGATLVLWDAMAAGRIASGERWAFAEYGSHIQIRTVSGQRLVERMDARPDSWLHGTSLVEKWNYLVSIYVIGDGYDDDTWTRLASRLVSEVDLRTDALLAGVSRPAISGLVIKGLVASAPVLQSWSERLWSVLRHELWGMACPAIRRY